MQFLIGDQPPAPTITFVCVGGGTASGKTGFVSRLVSSFQKHRGSYVQVMIFSLDSWYKPLEPGQDPKTYNFDAADAIDIEMARTALQNLQDEKSIKVPDYNFIVHTREPGRKFEINPSASAVIIIIEGIHALALADLCDYRLWIHAEPDVRLERRIIRDVRERGRTVESVQDQWTSTVQPTFERYEMQYRSLADQTIDNNLTGYDQIPRSSIDQFCQKIIKIALSK